MMIDENPGKEKKGIALKPWWKARVAWWWGVGPSYLKIQVTSSITWESNYQKASDLVCFECRKTGYIYIKKKRHLFTKISSRRKEGNVGWGR